MEILRTTELARGDKAMYSTAWDYGIMYNGTKSWTMLKNHMRYLEVTSNDFRYYGVKNYDGWDLFQSPNTSQNIPFTADSIVTQTIGNISALFTDMINNLFGSNGSDGYQNIFGFGFSRRAYDRILLYYGLPAEVKQYMTFDKGLNKNPQVFFPAFLLFGGLYYLRHPGNGSYMPTRLKFVQNSIDSIFEPIIKNIDLFPEDFNQYPIFTLPAFQNRWNRAQGYGLFAFNVEPPLQMYLPDVMSRIRDIRLDFYTDLPNIFPEFFTPETVSNLIGSDPLNNISSSGSQLGLASEVVDLSSQPGTAVSGEFQNFNLSKYWYLLLLLLFLVKRK